MPGHTKVTLLSRPGNRRERPLRLSPGRMRAALITALLLLTLVAGTASAHVRSTAGDSEIRLDGATVRFDLSLERSILRAASGHAPSPEAYLLPRVRVYLDGVECEGLGEAGIESRE